MKLIFGLLLALSAMPTPSIAQSFGSCSVGSSAWAPANETNCRENGGTYYPLSGTVVTLGASGDSTTITNATPKCPDGYQPVLRSGRPACARDVIVPQ